MPVPSQHDPLLPLDSDRHSSDFAPSTILVVEDDPDMRSLIRTFLEHIGYRVYTSGNADRATQLFRSSPHIDLLITDLYMPGRSGLQLAHDLKAMREDLPILMISGGYLDPLQTALLKQQGWSFLAKPFLLPDLLSTVNQILKSHGPTEELHPTPHRRLT
jgi:two-component system, chemotaxis family, chemotaxis protein CheY